MTGRARAVAAVVAALSLAATGAEPPANRLQGESSPYLLLHVHNPVDWYPWGLEAIERARDEDKPIFLSVGYSTCYWCHVMEREAFSDPETAAMMNRWFINIKVDREERPDLDDVYMAATQLLTRRNGGWPNSVFLTPDLEPFFAGTYFPIDDVGGLPGFQTVLRGIEEAWRARRPEVEAQAAAVAERVRSYVAERRQPAAELPAPALAQAAVAALKSHYDREHGGFGSRAKFPSPGNLWLLRHAGVADPEAAQMVATTLRRMGEGAIYDQLDGGFHRYTLDPAWRVPHFEKMLYDNALLAELLVEVGTELGDPDLLRLARGTLEFLLAEMRLPGGGFKSAIDAETDGEEGAFYVWTRDELEAALGAETFELMAPLLGFAGEPVLEDGKYTLALAAPLGQLAAERGLERGELMAALEAPLAALRERRRQRPFPRVDDKVLADWNGMAIAAFARAGRLLDEPRYLATAASAARFVLAQLRQEDGTLLHVWRNGHAKTTAFLDDYAFLIHGLLTLAEATGEASWRVQAERLAEQAEERLADPLGGFFLTSPRPYLLFQPKQVNDGAIPSGNAVMVLNLLALAEPGGGGAARQLAELALRSFAVDLERAPAATPTLALALLRTVETAATAATAAPAVVAGAARPAPATGSAGVVSAAARHAGAPAPDGWRGVAVELTIDPGWHVNANPASLDFLIPTAVTGQVRNAVYPTAEALRSAFAKEELAVYSGAVTIAAEVAPGAGEIDLTFQACDDHRCLPPVTTRLGLGEVEEKP